MKLEGVEEVGMVVSCGKVDQQGEVGGGGEGRQRWWLMEGGWVVVFFGGQGVKVGTVIEGHT